MRTGLLWRVRPGRLYARQVEKGGWLGLIGFLLFSGWMVLQMLFSFLEAAILPHLAGEYPPFVTSFLGMFTGIPSTVNDMGWASLDIEIDRRSPDRDLGVFAGRLAHFSFFNSSHSAS